MKVNAIWLVLCAAVNLALFCYIADQRQQVQNWQKDSAKEFGAGIQCTLMAIDAWHSTQPTNAPSAKSPTKTFR